MSARASTRRATAERRPVVLVTDCDMGDPKVEEAVFSNRGYELLTAACRTEADVIDSASEAQAVGLLVQYAPITRGVLDQLPALRAVARYGVGLDTIDLGAAAEHGVTVRNVPHYATAEVADHALCLLLALTRNLCFWAQSTAAGHWPAAHEVNAQPELGAMTLGLVGYGNIARAVAARGRALGMRILVHDPYVSADEVASDLATPTTWEELWSRSAVVSLHAPLNERTRGMVDDRTLALTSSSTRLINTARAGLIDRRALEKALRRDALAGVGLDVWWSEPPDPRDPLLRDPRVLVTPHVAWYSNGSRRRLRTLAAEALADALDDAGAPAGRR